jgi:hypothetical protein
MQHMPGGEVTLRALAAREAILAAQRALGQCDATDLSAYTRQMCAGSLADADGFLCADESHRQWEPKPAPTVSRLRPAGW